SDVCSSDLESAARLMQEANLVALAVVASEERFVGLLTFDDALEVIEAADTEDMARQSGASPVVDHYVTVSVFRLVSARALWLIVLLVAATLTVNVMQAYEATLGRSQRLPCSYRCSSVQAVTWGPSRRPRSCVPLPSVKCVCEICPLSCGRN